MKSAFRAVILLSLCFLASCGSGSGGGDDPVAGSPPIMGLSSASQITANGATLRTSVNPNGQAATAWFEWGNDPGLASCSVTGTQSLTTGTSEQTVESALTNLVAGATYYCRAAASNASGTSRGEIFNFTTIGLPLVTTLEASSLTATGATVSGEVNPHGKATNAWFEWGTDPGLDAYSSTQTQALGAGSGSLPVTAELNGLEAGTVYYYRAAALNGEGTAKGDILSFVPVAPPQVTTAAVASLTATGATLRADVVPNGLPTDAWFVWGTDPNLLTNSSTPAQAVGSGATAQTAESALTDLATGTTYYYRAYASNDSGTTWGDILSFIPVGAPSVTTLPATSITLTGGRILGGVTPNYLVTAAWFEWGTDPTLTTYTSTVHISLGWLPDQTTGFPLTGRTTGTVLYYRVVASNSAGTTRGEILHFTPSAPPTATTKAARSLTATSARLEGVVNPNGLATDAWFECGTDPALTDVFQTQLQTVGSGASNVSVSDVIVGLTENTFYYCRVAAQNNSGITEGAVTPFYPTSSAVVQKAVAYQIDVAHSGRAVFGLPLAFQVAPSWQLTLPDTVSYPIIANGLAYVIVRASAAGGYGTRLYALDLASGNTVWGPVAIGGTYYWAAQAYENGTLFVINFDGLLRAFDAVGGTLKWSTQLPGQYSFSAAPTVQNGIVYVGGSGSGGTLYAVNANTGAVLWTRAVTGGSQSSPSLGDNGVYVSYPGQAYKFDPVSGAPIWHYSGSVSGGGGSTPAYFNGMLFVRDWAVTPVGAVFNTATGAKGKTFGNNNMIPIPAFSATDGYFMMYGTLKSCDPSSLGSHWSFTGDGHLVSAPLAIDDVVVVGSSSGMVYAVDAASGVQKWSGQAGAAINGPDEWNVTQPLTGFAAGEGYLLVPAGSKLSAWHIAGQ